MAGGGTFAVERSIWTDPLFRDEPFSEREAFLWLVSEASWKARERRVGRDVVQLERGQVCASVRFMAERWGWSKSRVSRVMQRWKNRDRVCYESGTAALVITICNYDEIQPAASDSGTAAGQSAGQKRDTSGTNENQEAIRMQESPLPPEGESEPASEADPSVLKLFPTEESQPTLAEKEQEFWRAYPRRPHDAPKPALKRFREIVKRGEASPDQIIAGARRYAAAREREVAAGNDPRYTQRALTWLNQGGWLAEPSTSRPAAAAKPPPGTEERRLWALMNDPAVRRGTGQ